MMLRQGCLRLTVLGMLLMGSGCCKWCDRWSHHQGGSSYSAPACCVPQQCAPVCGCPPGTVPVQQGQGFQRAYAPTTAPAACCPVQ